jgi:hypothetical protein
VSLAPARPRAGLTDYFQRLEYGFDRLSEPRRLGVGLLVIVLLGTSWLYILGLTSQVLVNRASELDAELGAPTETLVEEAPPEVATVVVQRPPPTQTPPTPSPTPAVESAANLIEPPEVPDVPIVPAAPRAAAAPLLPLKPRVVNTAPTPAPRTPTPVLLPARAAPAITPVASPPRAATASTAPRANPAGQPANLGGQNSPNGQSTNGAPRVSSPVPVRTAISVVPTPVVPTLVPTRALSTAPPPTPPPRSTTVARTPTPIRR